MAQFLARLTSTLRSLPQAVLVSVGIILLVLLVAAAVYGYRVYNYVQHDNDFCLSCHLMVDPYERFAQSDHRGLGCKACHQPTPMVRARMGLTQIIRNPEELEAHAEVPNERCESCHVRGNPEEWTIISQSAGHRVHFESHAPSLQGLQCVQCHSSSVHEFTTTDKTCGQAGCHENVTIRLGKMSKLTLHCAACHDFTRPTTTVAQAVADTLGGLLRPQAQECLSCHAMRQRFHMPKNDPHNGACGACHNPHEQATPREAVRSCATSGCHAAPETTSPMHKGLATGTLANCTSCHQAHEFRITVDQCAGCHTSVPESERFAHARHESVPCASCHTSDRAHGSLKLTGPADCQACHHGTQLAATCTACHQKSEFAGRYATPQTFTMSVGTRTRTLQFDHARHEGIACGQCHRDLTTRSAENLQCNACHAEHHKPTVSCMACHPPASTRVHTRNVHLGCAGSECHKQLPVAGVPHTRPFCLTCHQTMVNHRPQGNCADCHRLPAARGAAQ